MKTENLEFKGSKLVELIGKIIFTKDKWKITRADKTFIMVTNKNQPAYIELMDLIRKSGKYVLLAGGKYCNNKLEFENELSKTMITRIEFGNGWILLAGKRKANEKFGLFS